MIVRRSVLPDVHQISDLLGRVTANALNNPSAISAGDILEFIAADALWVAVWDGRIVAFSGADSASQEIWALFVDPAYEGRGLGRRLLALAVGTLRNAGCGGVTLKAAPDTPAEAMYRAAGYSEIARSKDAVVFNFVFAANSAQGSAEMRHMS